MSDFRDVLRSWATWELEGRSASIVPFLEAVGAAFERPRIQLPPADEVDPPAVVSGRIDGIAVKVEIDHGATAVVVTKSPTENHLTLWFDPAAVERRRDADDPWADEQDLRVLVAPGVYVEGDDDVVAKVELHFDEVSVRDRHALGEVEDPLGRVRELIAFTVRVNRLAAAHGSAAARSARRETCAYCGSSYFFGVYQESCPGCGARP